MGQLRQQKILRYLEPSEIKQLEEIRENRNYKAGDVIFQEDFLEKNIVILESGVAEIVPKDLAPPIPIAQFYASDVIGDERFFTQNMPLMQLMIERDTNIIIFPKQKLKYMFKYNRQMLLKFLYIFSISLSDKIRKVNATLFNLMKDNVLVSKDAEDTPTVKPVCKEFLGDDIPGMSKQFIERIKKISSTQSYAKEYTVFFEGETGDNMYIIEQGSVKIFRTLPGGARETLADLGPGDFFGEMAFVDNLPRSASAIITSEFADLVVIPRTAMQKILDCGLFIGFTFLGSICRILSLRLQYTLGKVYQAAGYPIM